MDRLDEALKTFLIWKGLAHVSFAGYMALTFWMVYQAFEMPELPVAKAGLVGSMMSVGLPLMLNWYTGVMASTQGAPGS